MRRAYLLGLIAWALIMTGLLTFRGELLALALPLVLYLLGGMLRAPQGPNLKVTHHLSLERVSAHTPVVVSVSVTNLGPALDSMLLEDLLPAGLKVQDGSPRHLLKLTRGQTFEWKYTVSGLRGFYPFASLRAEAHDLLDVVRRENLVSTGDQLFILPPILRLRRVPIRPRRTRVYSGIVPARVGGPGVEFFGVREYQAGDPQRWINWQKSARQISALYSNEFEQERVADVGIVLDGRIRTNLFAGGRSMFEYSALAAATLADAFLAQGNRVGLLVYGRYLEWTFPDYGRIQRERILRALALAQPGSSQVFSDLDHLPTRLFPPRSQIVFISPLTEEDTDMLTRLRARDFQVMVISPDPVAFELNYLPKQAESELAGRILRMERELVLQRLQRAGVQLVNWDVSLPFDRVVSNRLGWHPAWVYGGNW